MRSKLAVSVALVVTEQDEPALLAVTTLDEDACKVVPTTRPSIGRSPHCPFHWVSPRRTVCFGVMSGAGVNQPDPIFRDESRDPVDERYGLRPIAPFAAGQGPPYANRCS